MSRMHLTRSVSDRKLAGVCGGIAAYAGVDSTLVRAGFVVLALFGSPLLYVLLWVVVPEGLTTPERAAPRGRAAEAADDAAALAEARSLAAALATGKLPERPSPLKLKDDEVEHFAVDVDVLRFAAGDPSFDRRIIHGGRWQQLFFGELENREAERVRDDARPRWRVVDRGTLHVTNRRAVLWNDAGAITSHRFEHLEAVQLKEAGVLLSSEGESVAFDAGRHTPYLFVLTAFLFDGRVPKV